MKISVVSSIAIQLGFMASLVYGLISLPHAAKGLGDAVQSELQHSGVSNPVTAVLLNFRAYDTLLEISVLCLSMLCAWSIGDSTAGEKSWGEQPTFKTRAHVTRNKETPNLVLHFLVHLLLPFLILLSGYLLWAGSSAPGGAFQAGSVLAAAVLLLVLADTPAPPILSAWPLRLGLIAGLMVFIAVGFVTLFLEGEFLQYPKTAAKGLMVLIEAAATISIGLVLAALFIGRRPSSSELNTDSHA